MWISESEFFITNMRDINKCRPINRLEKHESAQKILDFTRKIGERRDNNAIASLALSDLLIPSALRFGMSLDYILLQIDKPRPWNSRTRIRRKLHCAVIPQGLISYFDDH